MVLQCNTSEHHRMALVTHKLQEVAYTQGLNEVVKLSARWLNCLNGYLMKRCVSPVFDLKKVRD